MKPVPLIFIGLLLVTSGVLSGNVLVFTGGSLSLLIGNLKYIQAIKTLS